MYGFTNKSNFLKETVQLKKNSQTLALRIEIKKNTTNKKAKKGIQKKNRFRWSLLSKWSIYIFFLFLVLVAKRKYKV